MKRSTWLVAAAALVVVTAGGVVAVFGGGGETAAAQEAPATTVPVQRGELAAVVSLDGTLTYRARADGSPYSAINQARGIYTELPEVGGKVDCRDVLYRVDDHPVLLLCGAIPAYRDLAIGDRGKDVRQLNRNLGLPDEHDFTSATQARLEELQDAKGLNETGALDIDDAIFLPKAARIAKVSGELGGSASPGAQVAQASSDTLEVQVALDASQQGAVKEGDRAQITLPGNRSVTGKVARLGRVAQAPAGQDDDAAAATIPAYISLDKPEQARGLERAPVQVDVTTKGVKSALSVPVTALVGKSGGGFAVEVVRDGGSGELVAVALGLFDTTSGRVQVEGELEEGDRVVVPSS